MTAQGIGGEIQAAGKTGLRVMAWLAVAGALLLGVLWWVGDRVGAAEAKVQQLERELQECRAGVVTGHE